MIKTLALLHAFVLVSTGLLAGVQDSPSSPPCAALTPAVSARVIHYVGLKYGIPDDALAIASSSKIAGPCYRQLTLRSMKSGKELVVYLSPDQQFLISSLFDLSVDPAAEERAHAAVVAQALTAPHAPALGSASNPSTVVVFSDFQCPYCAKLATMLESYRAQYKDEARVLFRQFPLDIHPWARAAAIATICVDAQDGPSFWKLHDDLFAKQKSVTRENLDQVLAAFVAEDKKIDASAFEACRQSRATDELLQRDMELAKQNAVTGTPTLFVNGNRVVGQVTAEELHKMVVSTAAPSGGRATGTH